MNVPTRYISPTIIIMALQQLFAGKWLPVRDAKGKAVTLEVKSLKDSPKLNQGLSPSFRWLRSN